MGIQCHSDGNDNLVVNLLQFCDTVLYIWGILDFGSLVCLRNVGRHKRRSRSKIECQVGQILAGITPSRGSFSGVISANQVGFEHCFRNDGIQIWK
jgi:hypothetical protein